MHQVRRTIYLNLLINITQFVSSFGLKKGGSHHSESFVFSKTPNETICSTSFLNIYLCTVVTGYGFEKTGLESAFNSKYIGFVLHVPKVP